MIRGFSVGGTNMDKRTYETPKLVNLGSVADLTQLGNTHPGGDAKGGSVTHTPLG
jgi:hypothetical protein